MTFLMFVLIISKFLRGVPSAEFEITAFKVLSPIRVDGILDEQEWELAQGISDFTQREPKEGDPATERTEVAVLYDEEFLYIGAFCYDSQPQRIVATEMRRDAELRHNDYFEVFLDTFHDHRNAFYFATNPLGARRDALIREDGSNINWNWDGIWVVKSKKTREGWSVEMAIPFSTLSFKNEEDSSWGINFARHIARKREESFWSPIYRDLGFFGKYKISYLGHLKGIKSIKQRKRIQLMPFVIGGGVQEEARSLKGSGDIGLDLRYRLTSHLSADLTLNTDFAQVEADEEKFNLTRFSLFFPEKRGFFLENADIFRFGERHREHEPPSTLFFFSRRIGLSEDGRVIPILGGARVTGKWGAYDIGLMDIVTERTSYLEEEELVEIERINFSIFRLRRDFLEKSSLGLMFLSKDSLDSSNFNRGAGMDFNLSLGQSTRITGFVARTSSPELRRRDWATNLDFSWDTDFWTVEGSYTDIGENFNSEMGFVPRVDIRKIRANFGIGPRPKFFKLRQIYLFSRIDYIENHEGQVQSRNKMLAMFNIFQDGSHIFLSLREDYEFLEEEFELKEDVLIPQGEYSFTHLGAFYESDESKNVSVRAGGDFGEFYNGSLWRIESGASLKLSPHLNLELNYERNKFDLPLSGGNFVTNIASTRIVYSFSPDFFVKAYLQWNSEENVFRSNFLLRWIYKPGASLYLIYNETRERGGVTPLKERMLMLKVSFLFN